MASVTFRRAFAASAVSERLAMQVYSLRMSRGWTQEKVAEETGMAQPRISALESDCHNVTLATLRRLADAYDVALQVKFVPFSSLLTETVVDVADKPVASFNLDRSPIERYQIWSGFSSNQKQSAPVHMTINPSPSVRLSASTPKPTAAPKITEAYTQYVQ